MKRYFFVFLLLLGQLHALERESTLKMYGVIFEALGLKAPIHLYVNDKEYRSVFRHSPDIELVDVFEKSDIVLVTTEEALELARRKKGQNPEGKPIVFATDYHFLKSCEKAVGAFYWRKGRSQLLFLKKRLERHHITVPKRYDQFVIDEL